MDIKRRDEVKSSAPASIPREGEKGEKRNKERAEQVIAIKGGYIEYEEKQTQSTHKHRAIETAGEGEAQARGTPREAGTTKENAAHAVVKA